MHVGHLIQEVLPQRRTSSASPPSGRRCLSASAPCRSCRSSRRPRSPRRRSWRSSGSPCGCCRHRRRSAPPIAASPRSAPPTAASTRREAATQSPFESRLGRYKPITESLDAREREGTARERKAAPKISRWQADRCSQICAKTLGGWQVVKFCQVLCQTVGACIFQVLPK